jgi:hypothetical protein
MADEQMAAEMESETSTIDSEAAKLETAPRTFTGPRTDIYGPLIEAVAEMQNPALDSVNPHYNSRFASLKAVLAAIRGPLEKHGLMLSQHWDQRTNQLTTAVYNRYGDCTVMGRLPLPLAGTPQQMGSAITYIRRYSLLLAFGLVGDPDDDGNDAQGTAQDVSFEAACSTCGTRYKFENRSQFEQFLASGPACCSRPVWRR